MNNKIFVVDSNGNQIVAEGVSYIVLSGEGYKHEYLFYTLNEVVNGDLTKIYVAKVNEENTTIDDNEWENVKRSMLAIVHKEEVIGLSFEKFVDEQGNSKTFKIDFPRKIALKMDKLMGLRDEYRIALSNPESNSDTPAVGGGQEFFDTSGMQDGNSTINKIENVPSPFDGTMSPAAAPSSTLSASLPVANVGQMNQMPTVPSNPVTTAPVTVAPVTPELTVQQIAPVQTTPAVEVAPVTIETVAPVTVETVAPVAPVTVEQVATTPIAPVPQPVAVQPVPVTVETVAPVVPVTVEQIATPPIAPVPQPVDNTLSTEVTPAIQNVIPEPIPGALGDMPAINNVASSTIEITNEEDYAIPLSQPTAEQTLNMDSVIFDQIIEELNQIKNQNAEIRESIKRLSSNVETINNSIATLDFNKNVNNNTNVINTNTSNTTEEVSAVEINPNGSIVMPDYNYIENSANNAVNALTTNVIEPTPQLIEQPISEPEIINMVPAQEPTVIQQPVPSAPETTFIEPQVAPSEPIQMVPPAASIEVLDPSPVNDVQTISTVQPVTPQMVETPAIIDQTPQLVPDVPVYGVNVPEPTIVVPQFDPNAGLPPVAMPTGVAAGNDASAITGMIN